VRLRVAESEAGRVLTSGCRFQVSRRIYPSAAEKAGPGISKA